MPPVIGPKEQQRRHKQYTAFKDHILDSNRGAVETGIMALKAAILINGAAAIALLAFIGQLWGNNEGDVSSMTGLIRPLIILVGGVFSAALATGCGYLRMFFETVFFGAEIEREGSGKRWHITAKIFHYGAIILVIVAYGLFVAGMWETTSFLSDVPFVSVADD